ncbi:hypothetical protein HPG69_004158 [Diceros bicornis minor]|uniref:Uncharacterized protein n=1 Tax=Diceros bicornis minor TaxID=77932 RepID=A0A7J7E9Q5_DICBM|nr:hypothetical protein HPG69_004158 [Diceros bicornis minor]
MRALDAEIYNTSFTNQWRTEGRDSLSAVTGSTLKKIFVILYAGEFMMAFSRRSLISYKEKPILQFSTTKTGNVLASQI